MLSECKPAEGTIDPGELLLVERAIKNFTPVKNNNSGLQPESFVGVVRICFCKFVSGRFLRMLQHQLLTPYIIKLLIQALRFPLS